MCLYNWVITVAFSMHTFGIHFLMLMCATRTQSDTKKDRERDRKRWKKQRNAIDRNRIGCEHTHTQ